VVDGVPVVFLHGGPGSGCNPGQRRLFDPQRFRAILIDQRGTGRSVPLGELRANTTDHLVADLECVRQALGIAAWIVFGGSWGSLLGLRYAQAFPERVTGLVLRGIFLGSAAEIQAYVQGLDPALRGAWREFSQAMPAVAPTGLLAAFAQTILGGDERAALLAAVAWLNYERAAMGEGPLETVPDARQLAKVRIQMHYLPAECFTQANRLLADIDRIRHLPAVIVQGLMDPVCPPQTAEALHRAWPEAQWVALADAGHSGMAPAMASACMAALASVADQVA
jgi:proline iminopeptidase